MPRDGSWSKTGCHQRGGDASQRPFDHARKDIVRSSRDRHERHIATALGHHPVRAVAAKRDDGADPQVSQPLRGLERVAVVAEHRHWQRMQRTGECNIVRCAGNDAEEIGQIVDLLDTQVRRGQQDAPDDVDLFVVVERGAVRHDPANVLAGCRIRNDPDRRTVWHQASDRTKRSMAVATSAARST
ncbi:MAG: hypothetical protein R2848_17900 [Thermomicrobiales bacterium]